MYDWKCLKQVSHIIQHATDSLSTNYVHRNFLFFMMLKFQTRKKNEGKHFIPDIAASFNL